MATIFGVSAAFSKAEETTLKSLPQFIIDAKALSLAIADSQTDD